jgi:hypothetical protein
MPNWKKVIVSGSDASLNKLVVDTEISASIFSGSAFSGSFYGDGSDLTGIIVDDGLPRNDWDYNVSDDSPINDFQTGSTIYIIDFKNQNLVGTPVGEIAWTGNITGKTQLIPSDQGVYIVANDVTTGFVGVEGYSGSVVGIGNVMNFSSSVDGRLSGFASTGSNTFNGNQIISGSLTIASGSSIYGTQQLSGAVLFQPVADPDPLSQATTGTHFFVSSSNNQTGEDLYIRQIDNKVKWKWIEGKLNTGILSGGAISYSGSLVYVKAGTGIILSHNASLSEEISVTTNYVQWNDYTASCQNITSSLTTYLYVDGNGTIHQTDTYFTPTQYRTAIPIGMVNHTGRNVITSVANNVSTAYDDVSQTSDFIRAFGPMKLKGLSMTAATDSLKFTIEAGTSYILGGFYQQDPNNSSYKETSLIQTGSLAIARVRRDGSGGFIVDNNNGNFYNSIDPDYWDDGTGTLNTMASGDWQVQRVFFNPFTNRCHIYYGQNTYTTFINAKQYLATDSFVEAEYSAHQYVFLGYLVVKGQTNNLADDVNNLIVQSGLFRNTVGSSGGVQEFTHLHDLADVEVADPTNNDLLSYNSSNALWEHHSFSELGLVTTGSNALTGSQIVTGSLIVTGSVAGNVVALSVASGTASIDFRRGTFFTLTIPSSTITHITASNMQPGLTANLVLTQQATTGSVRWDSGFKFPSGSFNTGSASGSAVDIVSMMMVNTSQILSVGANRIQ